MVLFLQNRKNRFCSFIGFSFNLKLLKILFYLCSGSYACAVYLFISIHLFVVKPSSVSYICMLHRHQKCPWILCTSFLSFFSLSAQHSNDSNNNTDVVHSNFYVLKREKLVSSHTLQRCRCACFRIYISVFCCLVLKKNVIAAFFERDFYVFFVVRWFIEF